MAWSDRRDAPPDPATLEWVRRSVDPGSTVEEVAFLPGGSCSAIHRIRLRGGRTVVVRRWIDPDWRRTDPDLAPEYEAAALRLIAGKGIPAPELLAVRTTGPVPALVMTHRPGRSGDTVPGVKALAEALATVHRVRRDPTSPAGLLDFRFYNRTERTSVPHLMMDARVWHGAYDSVRDQRPFSRDVLVHRDFNPGNVLWSGNAVSGIVDWGAACWGFPGSDIGHLRWNLAVAHGIATADAFLDAYREAAPGYAHDPYWDVRAVLDLLPEPPTYPLSVPVVAALEDYLRVLLR